MIRLCLATATAAMAWASAALADDIRPATSVELLNRFGDTTEIQDDLIVYYATSGVLLIVEEGKLVSGSSWTTDDTGRLCWVRPEQAEECKDFVVFEDIVYSFADGAIRGQPDLRPGNLLAEAARAQSYAESAEFFTAEETRAFLSGKTAKRDANGRMYYAPDGTLKTVWNGVHKTGRWTVNDEGGVCWEVTGWGEQPCEYYYMGQLDTVWSRFRGLDRVAPEHVEGDITGEM